MSNVEPIVTVVGEVRGVRESSFTDRETGEVKEKVVASVLTRQGFIDVSVGKEWRPFAYSEGDLVVFEVAVLQWAFQGRVGTSFILDADRTKSGGLHVPAELVDAKK